MGRLRCFDLKDNIGSTFGGAASSMTRNVHELKAGFREKKTAHRLKGVQILLVVQTVMSSTSIPRVYKVNKVEPGEFSGFSTASVFIDSDRRTQLRIIKCSLQFDVREAKSCPEDLQGSRR